MKDKIAITLMPFLLLVLTGYGQADSLRTKNDKPGTPQSLRSADQTPQSQVNVINTNTAPGQTINGAAPGSNTITITADPNTDGSAVSTSPGTIVNQPPNRIDTAVKNSAIQNGVSNSTNPIRNN